MTKKRIILFVLVISWMILIFWFSSAGHEVSSGQSERVVQGVRHMTNISVPEMIVRKAAHVFLYFVLGILLTLLVRTYHIRWRSVVLWAVGIACTYAATDETHQLLVGGRSGQVSDVLLDTAAACAGAVIIAGGYKFICKLHKNQKCDRI
ncbi:VanZ family protein [TM7 phylum sp. oral taxon 349]|nr:VanZ family protein [TM7 phylum sp. oral taxon 349]RKV95916.1 MAG: VanZ family protein [Candidatus Saccharimonas sp.]